MAVFITGDVHGDFSRFKKEVFYEQTGLTKDAYVIICGDFGGVWDGSPEEKHWLDWLEGRPFTTLFVSGNHENFDMLAELPTEEWHGGQVQRVRPSVIHLIRGQVYEIQGKKFFTMGGASSHDISGGILEPDDLEYRKKLQQLKASGALYRVNHRSWWATELPSESANKSLFNISSRPPWRHIFRPDCVKNPCNPSGLLRLFALQDKKSISPIRTRRDIKQALRVACQANILPF